MPHLCAPSEWIKRDWLAIQIQRKFEFEWATNPCATPFFCAPLILHEKRFLMKTLHAQRIPRPSLLMPRVDKDWLVAFEFKFDLNSSEQPPSFILSRCKNAVKMCFALF